MKRLRKFAGLISADTMLLATCVRGTETQLRIRKEELVGAAADLEDIELPIESKRVRNTRHGTTITLTNLNQGLEFPSPEKLRELLIRDYGRESDFTIHVNGQPLAIDDIPGETIRENLSIPELGPVKLTFTLAEGKKALKNAGIGIRVNGKLVGRPIDLGIGDDEEIPSNLMRRVYGEIEADGLSEHVTADWGAIIENSKALQEVKKQAAAKVKHSLRKTFKTEVNLQKARLERQVKERLAKLPENRRGSAEAAINRVLRRFYGESDERIGTVVGLMLDAFERDEYWVVLQKIDDTARADVARLADILGEFGLVDLALIGHQTRSRLRFLDELDSLRGNPKTLEADMHKGIEDNLWVLGTEHTLIASNKTLRRIVTEWTGKKFKGKRANKRPDLFLGQDHRQHYLLIEFKRPSHAIDRNDEAQAIGYRDDLSHSVQGGVIDVLVIGGRRASDVSRQYGSDNLDVLTYGDLISQARTQLEWLLQQLGSR
ncbi:MAG: ATP-binding protein [Polyangiaceae bacterium]